MRITHPFGVVEEKQWPTYLLDLPLVTMEHPQGPPVAEDQDIDPDALEKVELEIPGINPLAWMDAAWEARSGVFEAWFRDTLVPALGKMLALKYQRF